MTLFLCLVHSHAQALDEGDLQTEVVEVVRVSDGDTLKVIFEDSTQGFVRFLAIQALEEHDADIDGIDIPPDCNATYATKRLAKILGCDSNDDCPAGTKVTLKAWDTGLISYDRSLRFVFIDDLAGGEIDVGLQLVKEGYVLAWPNYLETLYNEALWLAQANAMKNRIGPLWNSEESQCHNVSEENTQLDMWVNWDAPGNDSLPENRNGEWVKIKNNGDDIVNLSHWQLRDTGQQKPFVFPDGTKLPVGETVTVYVGEGENDNRTFYMNEKYSIFDNALPDGA